MLGKLGNAWPGITFLQSWKEFTFILTRFKATSGGLRLTFGFEEASKREEVFKEGNFS